MGEQDTSRGLRGRDLVGLGGILVAGVVGGLVIGLLVDRVAGTSPLWTLVGIALGILLGAAAFVRRVRDALHE
jgi:F0F1-type ATP synthase assembly protein I